MVRWKLLIFAPNVLQTYPDYLARSDRMYHFGKGQSENSCGVRTPNRVRNRYGPHGSGAPGGCYIARDFARDIFRINDRGRTALDPQRSLLNDRGFSRVKLVARKTFVPTGRRCPQYLRTLRGFVTT